MQPTKLTLTQGQDYWQRPPSACAIEPDAAVDFNHLYMRSSELGRSEAGRNDDFGYALVGKSARTPPDRAAARRH